MKKGSSILILLLISSIGYGQIDKAYHFGVGFSIGLSSVLIKQPKKAFIVAITAGTLAGIGKEIYDRKHGNVELMDAVATSAGAVLSSMLIYCIKTNRKNNYISIPWGRLS